MFLKSKQEENCVAQSLFVKENLVDICYCAKKYLKKYLKLPYVSRLLPLYQWISTDEEAAKFSNAHSCLYGANSS